MGVQFDPATAGSGGQFPQGQAPIAQPAAAPVTAPTATQQPPASPPPPVQTPMGPLGGPGLAPPSRQTIMPPGQPAADPSQQGSPTTLAGQPPAVQPPTAMDLLQMARQRNVQLPFGSSDEALDALLDNYVRFQQNQPYFQLGQQVAPYADQFQSFLQQQAAQASAQGQQPGKPAEPPLWDAPEFDRAWLNQVTEDANGNIIPRSGQPPEIAAKVARFIQWQRNKQIDMMRDPMGTLGPVISKLANEQAAKLIDERLSQARETNTWQQFAASNEAWLVARDQQGRPMMDRVSGLPMLTAEGQAFSGLLKEAENFGIADPAKRLQYASRIMSAQFAAHGMGGAGQQQAPPQYQQQPAQYQPQYQQPYGGNGGGQLYDQRFDFLRRAAGATNQYSGSMGQPGQPQNTRFDARQALMHELRRLYPVDEMFRQAVAQDMQ